ncbi:MAG: sigma-54-dependent Fis family transcriptional regulator [Deltaproteobacteria bacterium]|nr:sigma-54-dependent Fis family transcriptional regulator [Deltaproteobacteria bacterium]MBK8236129.1 sigma-54-dependent Fis family transcriptional regulator [Deltaproteobacteria bacterium]MBK8713745.1 sigma-54-dependent Fis family transcriptional regulator [Deltaproteobacteria bacterium]MBP7292182.1 sigma-54-dependent Fis family transcriptional regulator [Nannocystaceae bacterium]
MSRAAKLLVVDDDASVVDYLLEMLGEDGHQAVGTTSPLDALERIAKHEFDLVIADVEMPELRGLDLMAKIHAHRPGQLVLLVTAFGSIDLAVKAVRAGACDFVTKPFRWEALQVAIERALRERRMRREIVRLRAELREQRDGELVARSPAMRRVVEIANRVARSDSNTLVTGPSGVGKGAVARHIHAQSARAAGPFVQVNCAALPSTLAEAELFGVRRGAFTDAREDRPGLFVQAHGGTLMLDEIGEMALDVQAKLLQAIESRSVRPVGAGEEVAVDVRIIGATNRPLEDAVADKRFREDLYYRLDVVRIEIPPLADRPEDLAALVDVMLERACARVGREVLGVSDDAMRWLLGHSWPGNVRELGNLLERAVVLAEHDTLVLDDLVIRERPDSEDGFLERAARRGVTLEDVERAYMHAVLRAHGGNKTEAARVLGIDRRTLHRRLEGDDVGQD